MPEPSLFRHYLIVQNADGNNVELTRNADQVNVLGFDTRRVEFVHCHVLLEPLADRAAFEQACRKLQKSGHPLLARLVDFGEDEGNPFYITSNVDGESLTSYLTRQTELPVWIAVMLAGRSLEAAAAYCMDSDNMPFDPLECLRVLQTSPREILIQLADYPLGPSSAKRTFALKTAFEKQANFLRHFLAEKARNSSSSDASLPSADFTELLVACLSSAAADTVPAMRSLSEFLIKLAPASEAGEIPTANKPRALLAPHLAGYQEVARALVNRVRIQSQRLDMANPYAMRGTLTKTGRGVLVEQVPPPRLATEVVYAADEKALQLEKRRDLSSIVPLALLQDAEGLVCMAEEVAEGITIADLLKERQALDVHETYLVLAGLDAALAQLERSGLEVQRLRLEDIYLLTGFPREDARSTKLLLTKLTDWPAFSIMLRAHPTLAAMAGRGIDPAVLLPPPKIDSTSAEIWHAAWLSALARFLLGLEVIPGGTVRTPGRHPEVETVARLLDEELAKGREGGKTKRADFLGRYARIVHHHDLVKPTVQASAESVHTVKSKASRQKSGPLPQEVRPTPATGESVVGPQPLTSGLTAHSGERVSVGFAELLFRGTSETAPVSGADWAKTAVDAPPTIHANEALLPPDDFVPFWLRAAVFIGGSMILGGIFAHLSGDATWQKATAAPAAKPTSAEAKINPGVPKPQPTSATPAAPVPKAIPITQPQAAPPPAIQGSGSSLLKPPQSGLKEQILDLPAPTR